MSGTQRRSSDEETFTHMNGDAPGLVLCPAHRRRAWHTSTRRRHARCGEAWQARCSPGTIASDPTVQPAPLTPSDAAARAHPWPAHGRVHEEPAISVHRRGTDSTSMSSFSVSEAARHQERPLPGLAAPGWQCAARGRRHHNQPLDVRSWFHNGSRRGTARHEGGAGGTQCEQRLEASPLQGGGSGGPTSISCATSSLATRSSTFVSPPTFVAH